MWRPLSRGLVALLVLCFGGAAHAVLLPVLGWGYSLGWAIGGTNTPVFTGNGTPGTGASIWWDPPVDLLGGRVVFEFDPDVFTIVPEHSGFIGAFSDNPAVDMPYDPSGVYPTIDWSTIPTGMRAGGTSTLTVDPTRVTLEFDYSANPVTVDALSGHLNFYHLAVIVPKNVKGFVIETTATGDLWEVGSFADQSETYMTCRGDNGTYACGGTQDPSVGYGLTAVYVPEPGTWTLVMLGLLSRRGRRVFHTG
ncbi:MAG: hypothetical protein AB7Q81_20015 [Gammaproteobacteria bacterium]